MSEQEKQTAIENALHFIFQYLLEQATSTGLQEFQTIAQAYSNLVSVIGIQNATVSNT